MANLTSVCKFNKGLVHCLSIAGTENKNRNI